jgi:hypothetical protein
VRADEDSLGGILCRGIVATVYRRVISRDSLRGQGARESKKKDVPDNVRREPKQEGSQLAFRARLLEANLQPLCCDTRTLGERVPALDSRFEVFAREEADVVPGLRDRDVGHDLGDFWVESESVEDLAHARFSMVWNGWEGVWHRGERIDAPCGREYEGQLSGVRW